MSQDICRRDLSIFAGYLPVLPRGVAALGIRLSLVLAVHRRLPKEGRLGVSLDKDGKMSTCPL